MATDCSSSTCFSPQTKNFTNSLITKKREEGTSMISNPQIANQGRFIAKRSLATIPSRSPAATWQTMASFFATVAEALQNPRVTEFRSWLGTLQPLAYRLIFRHALEGGLVALAGEDFEIRMTVHYGRTESDQLDLPPVAALLPFPRNGRLTVTFFTADEPGSALEWFLSQIAPNDDFAVRVLGMAAAESEEPRGGQT